MHEVDRHSHSLSASALDVEVGLYVLPQGLKNEGAELALNWPLAILRQTDAVVGHDNLVMVFVLVQASKPRRRPQLTPQPRTLIIGGDQLGRG
jgi:hypothetical protein